MAVLTSLPSLAATSPTLGFGASAYGTIAFVGSTVTSGPTAPVNIGTSGGGGCGTPQVGAHQNGTVLSVSDPPALTAGLVYTSVASTSNSAVAISIVNDINLLGGLLTAHQLKAASTTNFTSTGLHVTGAGSTADTLVIAGVPIAVNPAPNTTVALPGVGKVVVNEQSSLITASQAALQVNMLHIYVTLPNALGIPAGTQIIIASAHSGLAVVPGPGLLDGRAYGSSITSTLVNSSPSAPESMPCAGTHGALNTNSVASVSVPPTLSLGTISDTAQGTVTDTEATGETTSSVAGLKLLSTLVTADLIKADAHASTVDGTNFDFSDSGSAFVNLKVAGFPGITDGVPANTQLNVAGIGTLYLHRVITTSNYIEVRMVELVVNQTNSLGLPVGADVRVGVASASLHSVAKP